VSIKVLRLMFCGGLFVQAIGVGSNHVAREAPVTLAKAIMKKTHHCHHATRWSSNGDDLKTKETRCNAPKTTRSRSSTYRINSQEVSVPINFCTTSRENNMIYLDIYKPHEVTLPMNQESSQSEGPTSGYGRITEGCTF
jgi:hypothetical protein